MSARGHMRELAREALAQPLRPAWAGRRFEDTTLFRDRLCAAATELSFIVVAFGGASGVTYEFARPLCVPFKVFLFFGEHHGWIGDASLRSLAARMCRVAGVPCPD